MKKISVVVAAFLVISTSAYSQDLGDQLRQFARDNAEAYVAPLVTGWGGGLNSGLYSTADVHSILGFDIHVRFTGAIFQDADKKYMFKTPSQIGSYQRGIDYPAEVEANSVVGPNVKTPVNLNNGTPTGFEIPGGLDIKAAPLIVPQVSIGLPFGFEVMGRFFPTTKIGTVGKVNMLGFGLRHDVDQYIPLLPLDVTAYFMTQKLNYEDGGGNKMLEASAFAYGLSVSKSLLIVTVYGGLQLESSTLKIGPYSISGGTGTVEFEADGKNKARFLAGVSFSLLILNIHADYSFASTPLFTLGAGISFR